MSSTLQNSAKHTYNPSTYRVETGRSEIQDYLWLQSKLEVKQVAENELSNVSKIKSANKNFKATGTQPRY